MGSMAVDPTPDSGSDIRKGAQAQVKYNPPVIEFVSATLTTGMVLELVMHLHGTRDEYEMSPAVEAFFGMLVESYPNDLPEGVR